MTGGAPPGEPAVAEVERLTGVYDADGSVVGELRYLLGSLVGRSHCALCDITHGSLRRKPSFDACRTALGIPFDLLHRDEQSPELAAVTAGHLPCVVVTAGGRDAILLDAEALDACGGDVDRFDAVLRVALAAGGFVVSG